MGFVALGVWLGYGSLLEGVPPPQPRLAVKDLLSGDADGFARVINPREFVFPRDHGTHPEYLSEWWYFTGNLDTEAGRHFGFQLTFFRFALTPNKLERPSAWSADQVYMAHLAITDVGIESFHAYERMSREALGLAGVKVEPLRIWLEDWILDGSQSKEGAVVFNLIAQEGTTGIDLLLHSLKPIVRQGDRGVSRKSAEEGNASYYYSFPRLEARGDIKVNGQAYSVTGLAWMDREWGTSALAEDQAGWDWFALQLDDGRDLMYYRLRKTDGGTDSFSAGSLVEADGSVLPLGSDDVEITTDRQWTSPHSGVRYPSGWWLRIPRYGLDLEVTPYLEDQELNLGVRYWEGAVRVSNTDTGGQKVGSGYVELAGYGGSN